MERKLKFLISLFILIILGLILYPGCKKTDTVNKENDTIDNPVYNNPANGKTTALFSLIKTYGTVTDADGNIYKTIVIGTQNWMAENLRTAKYRNGDSIQKIENNSIWASATTGAYCTYKNNINIDTIATYGRLYNLYALSDCRNIAPSGWHVATYDDWMTLYYSVGLNDGAAIKETGVAHWLSPNKGANNSSGFTALPGGIRFPDGTFDMMGTWGNWWCSKMYDPYYTTPGDMMISYLYDSMLGGVGYCGKNYGLSVRCVKDE